MSNELDEILKRIREEQAEKSKEETKTAQEQTDVSEPDAAEEEFLLTETAEEIEPALPKEPETEEVQLCETAENDGEKAAVDEADSEKTKQNFNTKIVRANIKTRLMPKVKAFCKKVIIIRTLIALGVIAVIIAAVFGGIEYHEYQKTAYLRPYEQKYGIEYPDGILEEFCDLYGNDRTTAGKIIIEDSSTNVVVSGGKNAEALMELGGTVLSDQHLRSVAIEDSTVEQYFSTPDAFLNSSQRVVFRTLFGDEEYKIAFVYYANTNPDNDNGYVFPYNSWGNMTYRSYLSYLDRVQTRSLFKTGTGIAYDDYLLSLNFPTNTEPDSRFVMLCVRTRDGVKFERSERTYENKMRRHTQAWYDENGEENIFRQAANWYPEIYTDAAKTKTKQLTAKDFE